MLINAELLGLIKEDLLVWHDDSDGLGVGLVGMHHQVGNGVSATIHGLELLESDVLATLHLDEVLDTIDDLEMTNRVPLSNITRLEPTIFGQSLGSLLWVAVVLGKSRFAPDVNLTLGWVVVGRVANVRNRDELHLNG